MGKVKLPKVRDDVDESLVVIWFVSKGDSVKKGDPLLEVQTEKEVTEIEADTDGVIQEIKVDRGETAKVGETLAIIGDAGEDHQPEERKLTKGEAESKGKKKEQEKEAQKVLEKTEPQGNEAAQDKPRIAPGLRKLARELGVDLETIQGTGRNGKITEQDIRGAQETAEGTENAKPEETKTTDDTVPLTGLRGVIARRMTESLQQSAQLTEMAWADVTKLERKKEKLTDDVGWTALIGKAVAQTLKSHPKLNAHIAENKIHLKTAVNLGFAVDTENGLMVAVIPAADTLSAVDLHKELSKMAENVRQGKLSNQESSGSSFTITSLGGHSVQFFTPIINPPEVAILGIGRIEDYLVMEDDKVRVHRRLPLSLTVDHRAVDGAPAAKFLGELIHLLEKPKRFLEKDKE